jgi:hypothetical protein
MSGLTIWWRVLMIFVLANSTHHCFSQDTKVRAGFVDDSTRVGDDVVFYLTARYPKTTQLVFPDSTFVFSPFELRKKDYFPTRTSDSTSYDSAVYFLRTFEVQPAQSLRLPVFIVNALDCTRVYSNRDTIGLRVVVSDLPDSLTADLPLKPTTAYQRVQLETNIGLILIIISFVVALAGIGWVVFGPALRRFHKLRRLRKTHEAFSASYESHIKKIRSGFSPVAAEAAMVEWKKYMEEISRRPYTKLTTRETMRLEKDELLGRNLSLLDSAVYGYNTNVMDSLTSLKDYADRRFNQVLEDVKNG